jgi:hypothetical protein
LMFVADARSRPTSSGLRTTGRRRGSRTDTTASARSPRFNVTLEEKPQGSGTDVDGRHRRSDRRQPQLIAMDILGGGLVGRPAQEIGKPFDVLQPGVDPVAADDPDDEVRLLQRDLNTLGADPQLEVDGRFGKQTRLVVKEFQATAGIVADGILGPVTMATIKLTLDTLHLGAARSRRQGF